MLDILKSFKEVTLTPVVGAEIEFYLTDPNLVKLIAKRCKEKSKIFFKIENEKGLNQFEIQTFPTTNILLLTKDLLIIKKIVTNIAKENNSNADFSAKPFLDKPGNALHIHINLLNYEGLNTFKNKKHLLWAISGLCTSIKSSMLFFAPQVKCYNRYQYPDENTPTTISWGYNNRTTAIRVVSNRIEHRVPCADSDVEMVINEILKGIFSGIKEEKNSILPTYGIASKNKQQSDLLPMTFSESKRYFINQINN